MADVVKRVVFFFCSFGAVPGGDNQFGGGGELTKRVFFWSFFWGFGEA